VIYGTDPLAVSLLSTFNVLIKPIPTWDNYSIFNNLKFNGCLFYIGGRLIENVTSYSHLGHIINFHSDDKDDVLQSRCNFTVQENNVLFVLFKTLDMHIKIKLIKSHCSSIYGSEL